ncbi:MAG: AAA family ATPase, partial [Candidatus Dormiibacterota bacterium]
MEELFREAEPEGNPLPKSPGAEAPLAARLRPASFEEMLGQDALLGAGGPVLQAARQDRLPSVILVGPPGSGKTTLARLLAASQHAHLVSLSAVSAGVADIRKLVEEARQRRRTGQRT